MTSPTPEVLEAVVIDPTTVDPDWVEQAVSMLCKQWPSHSREERIQQIKQCFGPPSSSSSSTANAADSKGQEGKEEKEALQQLPATILLVATVGDEKEGKKKIVLGHAQLQVLRIFLLVQHPLAHFSFPFSRQRLTLTALRASSTQS